MPDSELAIRVREIARHDARLAAKVAETLFLTQGKDERLLHEVPATSAH
jgi:hypothetical protein